MKQMIEKIKYYHRVAGWRGLGAVICSHLIRKSLTFSVARKGIREPVLLRALSSDISVYEQIYIDHEYDFDICRQPEVVVDAGANSGLASIYFANRFPAAKIIAIEPENGNFGALLKNAAPYSNIIPVHAALWRTDEYIDLCDPGRGTWAFRTREHGANNRNSDKRVQDIQGISLSSLMLKYGLSHIDILKIDIEGAEREVFETASAWIEKVDALIVELHEETSPGCTESMNKIALGFDTGWQQGENLYLARSGGCLVRSSY